MIAETPRTPSVGRVVHYVSYGTPGGEYPRKCRAAIVTQVPDLRDPPETVGLAVLNPNGLFFNVAVPFDVGGDKGGTWHWPEQVG